MARPPTPLGQALLGQVVHGKYRVEELLAEGGMGFVLRATHVRLDETVAIKILRSTYESGSEQLLRFEREARIAAKVQSEHAVRIFDVGELDDGTPFIVMEYLEGEDLRARLAGSGRLPLQEVADLCLQVCEAVGEAHTRGIIHRDLKPANLFLARRPSGDEIVKVLDFGIAKLRSSSDVELTQTATVLGSPLYMSPEQMVNARDIDHRADIWSLGVILYQCLTGETPFRASSATEIAVRVTQSAPQRARELEKSIPEDVDSLLGACLTKEREGRPENVAEIAAALCPYASAKWQPKLESVLSLFTDFDPEEARTKRKSLAAAGVAADTVAGTSHDTREGERRRAWAWPLFAAGAVAGTMAIAASRGSDENDPPGLHSSAASTEATEPTSAPRASTSPSLPSEQIAAAPEVRHEEGAESPSADLPQPGEGNEPRSFGTKKNKSSSPPATSGHPTLGNSQPPSAASSGDAALPLDGQAPSIEGEIDAEPYGRQ